MIDILWQVQGSLVLGLVKEALLIRGRLLACVFGMLLLYHKGRLDGYCPTSCKE